MGIRELLQKEEWNTKEEIQEQIGVMDNRKMIQYLFQILDQDISSFSYEKDYTYLLVLFDYFEEWLEEDPTLFSKHSLKHLESFHDVLKEYLITKPGEMSKKDVHYQTLKQLLFQIESFSLHLAYDEEDRHLKGLYPIVSSLVFDVFDLTYVDSIFKRFPGSVNVKDDTGMFLIEKVISRYFQAIEEKKKDQVIYWSCQQKVDTKKLLFKT